MSLNPVSRYYAALAKHRRQVKRFFHGPVGSWQTPWSIAGDGTLALDPQWASTETELAAAMAALTPEQRKKLIVEIAQ
jgi:hypothetical protein